MTIHDSNHDRAASTAAFDALQQFLSAPPGDLSSLSAKEQYDLILSKVGDIEGAIVSPSDLHLRLETSHKERRPLRIKFGIDPTGPDIHIGHAVSLLNLRRFYAMGHKIILVIGDFTGMIGDPSGRSDARPSLTQEDVERNMTTYEEQAARIINLRDPSIERHYNSEWMQRLDLRKWVDILKKIPVGSLLQREDFRKRITAGFGLSMAELEYALFMGYDSVVLKPDIELGGVDQYLNMHVCRQMMNISGLTPEVIVSYNLLPGTSGERDDEGRYAKMSKSRGNYISLTADPSDMYGKVMSIPDHIMWIWYRELTAISPQQLATLKEWVSRGVVHPKDAKRLLARTIVAEFNHFDNTVVSCAERDFDTKFGASAVLVPDSTVQVQVKPGTTVLEFLAEVAHRSKSDVRRLTEQQGVHLLLTSAYEPLPITSLSLPSTEFIGKVIRVGKRQYFRVTQ